MDELLLQLKKDIIEGLNLKNLTPEDISNDASLFKGGLELDSLDALELVFLLEKKHGTKISSQEQAKEVLISVQTMADFIIANRK